MITVSHFNGNTTSSKIEIPYSKSIANRLIAVNNRQLTIEKRYTNIDIDTMQLAVECIKTNAPIDAKEAGTVLRFSLALAASTPGYNNYLTGADKLMQRPINPFIDELSALGANIKRVGNRIWIKGKTLEGGAINLPKQASSQFISALLLVGHTFKHGLELSWHSEQSSLSYVQLTANLLKQAGIELNQMVNKVSIKAHSKEINFNPIIEHDWSGAIFFICYTLIKPNATIELNNLSIHSTQAEIAMIQQLKQKKIIEITTGENSIIIRKVKGELAQMDFISFPDAAMGMIISQALLGSIFKAKGLETLNLKESMRLDELKATLTALNCKLTQENYNLYIDASELNIPDQLVLDCKNDHRLAMTYALIAIRKPIQLIGHDCVTKSFPYFWKELKKLGYTLT